MSYGKIALPLVALFLAACANHDAERALMAQQTLVGMPKQTLLSCAGVPARTAAADNIEYFTYESGRTDVYPSTTFGFYGGHNHYGYGVGVPLYGNMDTTTCSATFTLRNGVVERIVYGGAENSGSARLGQCYHIVENCIPTPPPAAQ